MLGIVWPLKTRSEGGRGYMRSGLDMGLEVVGGRNAEIGWGWTFLTLGGRY